MNNRRLDITLLTAGCFLCVYYLVNAVTSGFIGFSLLFLAAGIFFIIYAWIELKLQINLFEKLPSIIKKGILLLMAVGLLCFSIIEAGILYYGQKQDNGSSDVLIVLGAGLMGDQISQSLRYRLDAALDWHIDHANTLIIVTGGQGYGETRTEASAMKEYLVQNGVPEERILMEDQSTNTYENFMNAKTLLNQKKITAAKATVITNNFHMMRAAYLGTLVGFEVLPYAADTYKPQLLNDYVREFFACIKSLILYH